MQRTSIAASISSDGEVHRPGRNRVPITLRPAKGRYGQTDYEKAFCANAPWLGNILALRGIDRGGCMVVVRPDQSIADVVALHDHDRLAGLFDGFMRQVASVQRPVA